MISVASIVLNFVIAIVLFYGVYNKAGRSRCAYRIQRGALIVITTEDSVGGTTSDGIQQYVQ